MMRHRYLWPAVLVFLAAVACSGASTPRPTAVPVPTMPLPTLLPPPATPAVGQTLLVPVAVESFDGGVEGWHGWAEAGMLSEVVWDSTGKLLWSVEPVAEKAVALAREWSTLAKADGLTIRLTSLDRSVMLVLGLQEADGSSYTLVLPLSAGETVEYAVPFSGLGLDVNGEDENGQLDLDQLVSLNLIDISGFLAAPNSNRIVIDEIVLWQGALAPFDLSCGASTASTPGTGFRIGVDANFVPEGEKHRHGFWVDDQRVDPLALFAANGADAFRVRLWVGDEGEFKLDYATDIARRAQEAGMRPYLVLFLSEDWADVNKQPAPAAWAGLTVTDRVDAVRQYTQETVQHFVDQGVEIDFYEIGNEIDYGVAGIFADTTHPRDAASLREDIWPDQAQLLQAAVDGVREADPDARFMLHIATNWDPAFAVAFFQAMTDLDVTYDYIGLSYYPSAFGVATADRFCVTLDRLAAEVGKPVIIAETAYPAEPPTGGMFGDWRRPLPGYPLSPEGQAWWLGGLLSGMHGRSDVLGVYYFSPGFWFSGELWGPFALFDGEGRARPAVGSFTIDGR